MFEPDSRPRVFAVPIGCDFLSEFVSSLMDRLHGQPPEALARVEIFVNTRRAERRLHTLLVQNGARLLPKVRLITDIASHPLLPITLPPPVSALRRRLVLARLVHALLEQEADIAPHTAVFDLADSLAALMDEMQGEGVPFAELDQIQVGELSAHWDRSLQFLRILADHSDERSAVDPQSRQRQAALAFVEQWQENPPSHPIIVAGSTGSRGASALFMKAVAKLPQGAVILPGVDDEMPAQSWDSLSDSRVTMDHPQSGINKFYRSLSLQPRDLEMWSRGRPFQPERNALISLALRPAPFTDQWLEQGPRLLPLLATATQDISLVEAENLKEEASAIALRLRQAAEDGKSAVLISPNRELTRRVAVNLRRWQIIPDDSAGKPLHLTPPGIFLRLLSGSFGKKLTPLTLISLLKHPLTSRDENGTGDSRRLARDLERQELRGGAPFVDFQGISQWANRDGSQNTMTWAIWLQSVFEPLSTVSRLVLSDWLHIHREIAEKLAAGPGRQGSGELWEKETGREAERVFGLLKQEADAAGPLGAAEYHALFSFALRGEVVRESVKVHPEMSILGTLEARVQCADLVILGGLNEGIWPGLATPDPWLNRSMRKQIGLPLPERQTGLSAHDFQQAIGAKEVLISRSVRDGDAPTIASRWMIRLLNLLNGLGGEGKDSISQMRQRGQIWIDYARMLDRPSVVLPKVPRPSPSPPVCSRPRKLAVTKIKTLVRNPYDIYVRSVLRLKKLDALGKEADALSRGIALHKVLEKFVSDTRDELPENAVKQFVETADRVLENEAPWPAVRRFWLARLTRISDWFVSSEITRRTGRRVAALEVSGARKMEGMDFLLTSKADRIDVGSDGAVKIYDYKSGSPPSFREIKSFDKQLQLEAAIAEFGGFDGVPAAPVSGLEYIGLREAKTKGEGIIRSVALEHKATSKTWDDLRRLIVAYHDPQKGYTARLRMQMTVDVSDFDHLSRRGEWEDGDDAKTIQVP